MARDPRLLLITLLALALVAAGFGAYGLGRMLRPPPDRIGTVLDEPRPAGDLALSGAGGERTTLGAFAADAAWTLVFFGFVDCPDVCPLTMAGLARTYRGLGEPDGLRVAMITVDPERDDPERVAAYARGFHPSFAGFGGSAADVAAATKRFYVGVSHAGHGTVHTGAVALVDRQGRMRAVYGQGDVARIGVDLADLLEGRRL